MNEDQWLSSLDPHKMLDVLEGKASDRKLRLFIVACLSRVPSLETGDPCRVLLTTFEQWADGLVSREAVVLARQGITSDDWEFDSATRWVDATLAARAAIHDSTLAFAQYAACGESHHEGNPVEIENKWAKAAKHIQRQQALHLRDIFDSLPFRATPSPDLSWLVSNNGAVLRLARAIYDERAFERMPVLGDALEEAGCCEPDILGHCRQQAQAHTRGCWVVDLLLGKQ